MARDPAKGATWTPVARWLIIAPAVAHYRRLAYRLSDPPPTDVRYNFAIHTADAGFFGLGLGFASFVTVLPLFLATLTGSPLLLGLIAAIQPLGWHLPQILTAERVTRLRRYMPMILVMTANERIPFFFLAAVAALSPRLPAGLTLALTYGLVLWIGIGGGLTATPFQAMVAKIIPHRRIGAFYGLKTASANLLLALGAVGAGAILDRVAAPASFSLCFALAGLATVVSWIILARTREPDGEPVIRLRAGLAPLRLRHRIVDVLGRDHNFRWFLAARSLAQITVMAAAFYTVYAVQHFGISATTAGAMTAVFAFAQVVANPAMGWAGDHWGYRRIMALGLTAGAAGAAIALAAPAPGWLFLAYFLTGVANVAAFTLPLALNLRFGTPMERTVYIGLSSSLTAPSIVLAPIVGGLLASLAGYGATFLLAALGGLGAALVLRFRVVEPGRGSTGHGGADHRAAQPGLTPAPDSAETPARSDMPPPPADTSPPTADPARPRPPAARA